MVISSSYYSVFAVFSLLLKHCNTLIPYKKGEHEDPRRNYRYVRSCQEIKHGNMTHVSIKPKETPTTYETMYIKYNRHYGHRTIIRNPLHMISVLEPYQAGSCEKKKLSSVLLTAKKHKCAVAINAGFFSPNKGDADYGKCFGNIISDGRMVQNSHGIQNACFGIRRDGTILIGYLSEDEFTDKRNPFVQLVCGVGWVLRNGETYLDESKKAECRETETTGSLDRFFTVIAARTLIGYDKNGHVHLVQFDGETWKSGVDLYAAATYMKSIGIINAINFDGGGSSTYVVRSTVINYPSGVCENSTDLLCTRNVSTIICVHDGKKHKSDQIDALSHCCNRNYFIIIGMSVIVAITLLGNVYLCGFYVTYRTRFSLFSGTSQKKEALKSLLDQNGQYSTGDDESEEDELHKF